MDYLTTDTDNEKIGIACYYCDYSDMDSLRALVILGTIIKQLLGRISMPADVANKINQTFGDSTRTPDTGEAVDILLSVMNLFPKVYLIIDGLDECESDQRLKILSVVHCLAQLDHPKVLLFISSREEADIVASLGPYRSIRTSEENISRDITSYISDIVSSKVQSGELILRNPALEQRIVAALVNGAQGMYGT
jgi:hypothetical protein